jgi:hypothetical protein
MADYEIREYLCSWPKCGTLFRRIVGIMAGQGGPMASGKTRHVSSQVVCPVCKNGLKTRDNFSFVVKKLKETEMGGRRECQILS